jgi:pullulanase
MKKHLIFMMLVTGLFCSCQKTPKYASYDDYPVYDGSDLELTYTPEASTFRVWAPTAAEVKLLLYDDGNDGGASRVVNLKRSESGTWKLQIKEDLVGKFYTFQVKVNDRWLDETPACG